MGHDNSAGSSVKADHDTRDEPNRNALDISLNPSWISMLFPSEASFSRTG